MKKYKFIYLLILSIFFSGCDLEEEPPFLASENVYSSLDNARGGLDGIYTQMAGFNYMLYSYKFITNLHSGLFSTKKAGNSVTSIYNNFSALKTLPNDKDLESAWSTIYLTIGRANVAIASIEVVESEELTDEQTGLNDIAGQAYFLRAYNYFNLVRLWGEVPLRLEPVNKNNIHLAKSSKKEVYAQILSDLQMAIKLMNNTAMGIGYPTSDAAHMLLAKVYMTLATAPAELQDFTSAEYWSMAYDAAKVLYGNYELVSDYEMLWGDAESNNTSEAIFELQLSETSLSTHNLIKAFTPSNYLKVGTWGQFYVHAHVYDRHAATYPTDNRMASTYLSEYTQMNNGKPFKTYPTDTARKNFGKGHPYLFKFSARDQNKSTLVGNKNVIVYRYAELLLMLSEISYELGNGEHEMYVKEVLERAGVIADQNAALPTHYQTDFIKAIMQEYNYELMGEGEDWFNNRRRGYQWFMDNIVTPHNADIKEKVDIVFETDEAEIMSFKMPSTEINTNQLISE